MQARFVTAFALFALMLTIHGADEKLPILQVGSQTYSNVIITKVTATDIHFFHARGITSVKLKNLDPEMQKHFHFDAAAAQAAEQQQAANTAAYNRLLSVQIPTPGGPAPPLYAKSILGQKAPALVVEKWLTPQPDTRGKFILIDFWATWCVPCKQVIPMINVLHAKYKDRVVFIGLSHESEADVRKLTTPQMDYSVAIDTEQRMKGEIEIAGIPHAILIDPHGVVRFQGHPALLNEKKLGDLVNQYAK